MADSLLRMNLCKEARDFVYNFKEIRAHQEKEKLNEEIGSKFNKEKQVWMNTDNKLIIPEKIKMEIVSKLHEYLGHPGMKKMYYLIKEFFYIKRIKESIEYAIQSCKQCNLRKPRSIIHGKAKGLYIAKPPLQ